MGSPTALEQARRDLPPLAPARPRARRRPPSASSSAARRALFLLRVVSVPCVLLLVLRAGRDAGAPAAAAYAAAFLAAAGCNLLLRRLARLGDGRVRAAASWRRSAAALMLTLACLAAGTGVYLGLRYVDVPGNAAAVAGLVVGATAAAGLRHSRFFGYVRVTEAASEPVHRLRALAHGGIAFFLPAHNEVENLQGCVEDLVTTFQRLAVPYRVIIVDDGSTDGTRELTGELSQTYEHVDVIRHEVNRGYGAALRTGLSATYETGMLLIGFSDSDRQFRARSIETLLSQMARTNADMVVGFRIARADSLKRRLMGSGWHALTRLMLGFTARDVDCGFKLVDRSVIEKILPRLDGDHAAISPQLLAYAGRYGFRIEEAGVTHYPRTAGKQTGGSLKVVLGSFVSLFKLRSKVTRHAVEDGRRSVGPWRRTDPWVRLVFVVACLCSIGSFAYFYAHDVTLSYKDAISHLLISRRVVSSTTPGLAQLGGVWLPLPHLLALPLVWYGPAYESGICGSIVSMVSYVVCGVLLYKFGWRLTGRRSAGLVTAGVFLFNPSVLYMQSTPMTETLLLACIMGSVYGLLRWIQTDFRYQYLVRAAGSAFLATLSRYEGWVLLIAMMAALLVVALRSRLRSMTDGILISFATLAALGVIGWAAWNQLILGDWLGFQRGEYAKPSLWVDETERSIGHLDVAIGTYGIAVVGNLTLIFASLAVIGLVVYLARTRLSVESLPALVLVTFFPFFSYALYSGQRPLHVMHYNGELYNVRFGLIMILAAAVFVGYLTAQLGSLPRVRGLRLAPAGFALGLAIAVGGSGLVTRDILTLEEPQAWARAATSIQASEAADFLSDNYTSGLVLMESFGNEQVMFESQLPSDQCVYEGSYKQWERALADPRANGIEWIYMRRSAGTEDHVMIELAGSKRLAGYELVYSDADRLIYATPEHADEVRQAGNEDRT
ncbi:glycosyltransferase [Frankia sp. CNm7]|uniref:Glycosyltransferase n=1 Tax=Frankia nepalensis TaxID=1836974 RepID=A0A937RP15_9ACTN|nr:glycosyltransferase [Frankia nepalensis]MBL7495079.1 glycosyltransferase [Frankia nepalensis]MBL7513171.1 glycosyltransferase [Frankia nepalensis]MBL7524510.1 glycosyltransferase [Frankia nepalensis]MBL7632314.1 glycosyltransferase [Frankia nepalensis]